MEFVITPCRLGIEVIRMRRTSGVNLSKLLQPTTFSPTYPRPTHHNRYVVRTASILICTLTPSKPPPKPI
jgi:hypothetical protein